MSDSLSPTPEASTPRAQSRGNPAMGDIVRTTVVLGAIVLVVFGIGQFLFARNPDRPTAPVDWRTTASGVRRAWGFTPMIPAKLPKGWYASSARFDTGTWHLGITDKKQYTGLEQAKQSAGKLVARFASSSKSVGTVTLAGARWDKRVGGGRTVFVRRDGDTAVLVTGTGSAASVADYAASLKPLTGSAG